MPVTIKLKGVEQEFARKDKELISFVNSSMRARALQALGDLKSKTPVDTGRARNSWVVSLSKDYFIDSKSPTLAPPAAFLSAVSSKKVETVYITNGVSYIDKLNAGSSKQAPSRFVENTVLKYFDIDGLVYTEV